MILLNSLRSYISYVQNGFLFPPEKCRFCLGTGNVTVELGRDEKEVSRCINCDGAGSLTCTTCQGTGIQPRYLDRRYESVNRVSLSSMQRKYDRMNILMGCALAIPFSKIYFLFPQL